MNSSDFGKKAEKLAQEYLKSKSYKILEKNWRTSHLEVDLIARKDDFVVIIEVKARKYENNNFEEVVSRKKQENLIKAAENYLELHDLENELRFDVIFVYKKGKTFEINHVENAFYATLD